MCYLKIEIERPTMLMFWLSEVQRLLMTAR